MFPPKAYHRRGPAAAVSGLLLFVGLTAQVQGYSNCNPTAILVGGPHRVINQLAVARFQGLLSDDDPRQRYAKAPQYELIGPRITQLSPWMEAPPQVNEPLSWQAWIIEGGFTADEPELFNSFRHFYDPEQWNPDPPLTDHQLQTLRQRQIQGVPYLTDHLNQIRQCLGTPIVLGDHQPYTAASEWAAWYVNVKVDAKSWAIAGHPGEGGVENAYCWEKGRRYFQQAFAGNRDGVPLSREERDRLYAQAWRALGETMHLLADMTAIPHVRNDSHPGVSLRRFVKELTIGLQPGEADHPDFNPNLGILKNDPYELYVQDDLVRQCVPDPLLLPGVPPGPLKTIQGAPGPEVLFDLTAGFTNRHFVSADTIPFIPDSPAYRVSLQANGCRAYRQPWFHDFTAGVETERAPDVDRLVMASPDGSGYYKASVWERDVRLCHRTWLTYAGWGAGADSRMISYRCVQDQASVLVPLAVLSTARLVDLFVPKLEVVINQVDYDRQTLDGEVRHTPYGAFPEPLTYNDSEPRCRLRIGSREVEFAKGRISVKAGRITAQLTGLEIQPHERLILEMDIAGLRIPSPPYGSSAGSWFLTKIEYEDNKRSSTPVSKLLQIELSCTSLTASYPIRESNDKWVPPLEYDVAMKWGPFPEELLVGSTLDIPITISRTLKRRPEREFHAGLMRFDGNTKWVYEDPGTYHFRRDVPEGRLGQQWGIQVEVFPMTYVAPHRIYSYRYVFGTRPTKKPVVEAVGFDYFGPPK